MRRYVPRRSCLPRVNDVLQPPSPLAESHGNPLEPGGNAPATDSSEAKQHVPPDPLIISSVEKSDSKPNPDNAESSGGTRRRTIVGWFRTMTKNGSHSRTADQTPSEESHRTGTPPSNKKSSTIAHAKREKVRSGCFP